MGNWDFELNNAGAVIKGQLVLLTGQLHENGVLIPQFNDLHTFSFDLRQVSERAYRENRTEEEVLEMALVEAVRDIQRSLDPIPVEDDYPDFPKTIVGFENKSVRGNPKRHRDGELPPPAPTPLVPPGV